MLEEREHRVTQVLLAELGGVLSRSGSAGRGRATRVRAEVRLRRRLANAGLQRARLRKQLAEGEITQQQFDTAIQSVIRDGQEAVFKLNARHADARTIHGLGLPGAEHAPGSKLPGMVVPRPGLVTIHLTDFPAHDMLLFGVARAGRESLHPQPLTRTDRREAFGALTRMREALNGSHADFHVAEAALETLSGVLGHLLADSGVLEVLGEAAGEDVVILLDTSWNLMPWEAAACGGGYLGIRHRLIRNHGMTLLRLLDQRARSAGPGGRRRRATLFCPDPDGLPGTVSEIERVAQALEDAGWEPRVRMGAEATRARFIATMRRSPDRIIHFAGHSTYHPADSLLSAIHLHPGSSRAASGGLLTACEIQGISWSRAAPLVYLSSCESAVAEIKEGNEAFGLSRAFLLAGASSLVLANWPVPDSSAPEVAAAFYAALLRGHGPGEALRHARQEAARSTPVEEDTDGGRLVHWAPFTVHGSPSFRSE